MYYIQFREGEAYLLTAGQWFVNNRQDLMPNFRSAKIETNDPVVAREAFLSLEKACWNADPTIDWDNVSDKIETF